MMGPWARGANNVAREDSLPRNAVRHLINGDFLPGGKVRRRGGSATQVPFPRARSLWSDRHNAFFAADDALYRFVPRQDPILVTRGVALDADLVYCSVNDKIYVSDGATAWKVDPATNTATLWSVPTPARQPTLTAVTTGGMDAGTYQLAITYARADGEESGATLSTSVDVPDGGGIALSSFPVPPADVATIQIYLTEPNGTEEALYAVVPANVTSATLARGPYGRPLLNQLLSPLPPARDVVLTNGRLFVAYDRYLCWSEPLQFGLYSPERNYVAYASQVDLIVEVSPAAQSPGLFVAVQGTTYFESGSDPADFTHSIAYKAGAVRGAKTYVSGASFEDQSIPSVSLPVWVSSVGTVCVGMPDGSVRSLNDGAFAMATGDRGSALVRELNGLRQVLFSMRPPAAQSRLAATDTVTITRVKNGVPVP